MPTDSSHTAMSGDMETGGESRAKTAPSKRKSWALDSIELQAEDGNPLRVKAPSKMIS